MRSKSPRLIQPSRSCRARRTASVAALPTQLSSRKSFVQVVPKVRVASDVIDDDPFAVLGKVVRRKVERDRYAPDELSTRRLVVGATCHSGEVRGVHIDPLSDPTEAEAALF